MDNGLMRQLDHEIQTINQDQVKSHKGVETEIAFNKIALVKSPSLFKTIGTVRIAVFRK